MTEQKTVSEISLQHPDASEPPALKAFRARFSVFGGASALYAIFFTLCLYKNTYGITYPFFVAGTLYYFCFCMKKCKVPLKKDAPFYMGSLLALGLSVCMTADPKLLRMTKTGIFLLFISFLLHHFYNDEKWGLFKYPGAILSCVLEALMSISLPFADCISWLKTRQEGTARRSCLYVILGLICGIPLLALILILLSFADRMFEMLVDRLLGRLDFYNSFLILTMVFCVFIGIYSLLASLQRRSISEECKAVQKADPLTAIVALMPILVVYLIFCLIQIVYLFGRFAQLPAEYTWASYARQGFFQLLFVCLINLSLVCFCQYRFGSSRALKYLLTSLCLMTYIMIASSAYRMLLYIQAYDLTFLRILVLWALAVITLTVTGALISLYRKTFPLFRYCMMVITVCYICLAFSKPDYLIANYNLFCTVSSESPQNAAVSDTDLYYLTSLSADAAPVLLRSEAAALFESSYGQEAYRRYCAELDRDIENMGILNFNFSLRMACHFDTSKIY